MPTSTLESYKIKAKLLQKAKLKANKPILLKEAYQLIAKNAGFDSWKAMKDTLSATGDFCPLGTSAFWKTWYPNYEAALEHLRAEGGFLLPFQRHFFICDIHYVEALGISKDDKNLKKVGNNWVEPNDLMAWDQIQKVIKAKNKTSSRAKK